ncbi:MAG: helix-turn-helix transcriptional regulator [Oscillospiraceae bacterium]|nr:helix-turn-helix transcriptional regulator [Oscillospiraceae bacterium]
MTLGVKIIKFRDKLNVKPEQLSQYLKITQKELTDIENGESDTSLEVATRLSYLLGINVWELLRDSEYECRISCNLSWEHIGADTLRTIADIHRIAANAGAMEIMLADKEGTTN